MSDLIIVAAVIICYLSVGHVANIVQSFEKKILITLMQCRIKVCGGPRPMSMWGPLTLSKRSATIGWRGAYKRKLGQHVP